MFVIVWEEKVSEETTHFGISCCAKNNYILEHMCLLVFVFTNFYSFEFVAWLKKYSVQAFQWMQNWTSEPDYLHYITLVTYFKLFIKFIFEVFKSSL